MPRAKTKKPATHKAPVPYRHVAPKGAKGKGKGKAAEAAPLKPVPPRETWPAATPGAIWRRVADLKPHPRNANVHPEKQLKLLDRAWRAFGQAKPIVINGEGVILAGHGWLEGAKRAGVDEVVVAIAETWDAETQRAYMLADNQLATLSRPDADKLRIELADLSKIEAVDISALGFTPAKVLKIVGHALVPGETDPDVLPEAGDGGDVAALPIVSRLGDVWQLGAHRLGCGDCTNADAVAAVLAGAKPHLMVTDPPYGVDYDPEWRNRAARTSSGMGNRAEGAGATGVVENDHRADWREAWALFPGEVAYVWHADRRAAEVFASLEAADFTIRAQIIWAKDRFVISRGHYHYRHEPCWYAVRDGGRWHWQGARDQDTVWEISLVRNDTGHSTQKPLDCMLRPILNNSAKGDAVYEPFSGSGTTLIAAETSGRRCYALEINPAYVDLAVRRWEDFTKKTAILAATGETFAAVAAARRADETRAAA